MSPLCKQSPFCGNLSSHTSSVPLSEATNASSMDTWHWRNHGFVPALLCRPSISAVSGNSSLQSRLNPSLLGSWTEICLFPGSHRSHSYHWLPNPLCTQCSHINQTLPKSSREGCSVSTYRRTGYLCASSICSNISPISSSVLVMAKWPLHSPCSLCFVHFHIPEWESPGRDLEGTFLSVRSVWHFKRCSTLLLIRKTHIKTAMRCYLSAIRLAKLKVWWHVKS